MNHVAVVILNFNGKAYIQKFLQTLIDNSKGYEVIVADNCSTDDSVSFLKKNFPTTRLIELKQNYGYAGGYNHALKLIEADYYALVNSDIEVTNKWLDPLVSFMDENKIYASCQPKIKAYHNKTHFEYAGASGGFIDSLGYPYCRGRIFEHCEEDKGQYDNPVDVFWTSGACMMIRSTDFWTAGGFDEDFFAHMEEIDLCWRLNAMERKLICLPDSVVFHVGGGTLSKSSPQKTFLNFKNGLSLLMKNLPLHQFWKIPLRMGFDLLAAFKFWVENDFSHFRAILNAQLHFVINASHDFTKRKTINQSIQSAQLRPKSILWNYFIQKKKKYRELFQ